MQRLRRRLDALKYFVHRQQAGTLGLEAGDRILEIEAATNVVRVETDVDCKSTPVATTAMLKKAVGVLKVGIIRDGEAKVVEVGGSFAGAGAADELKGVEEDWLAGGDGESEDGPPRGLSAAPLV